MEGTVDHGDKAVVLLLPKPFVFPELPLGARCTTGGKFRVSGVPPGDYYPVALDEIDTSAPLEPDSLRKLLPLATAITITKGSTATLDLSLSRKPD